MIATSRKGYAEVTTSRVVDNETLASPRISVSRLSHQNDFERFNSTQIRRLGWATSPLQSKLRYAKYPIPILLSHQVDMITRFVSEMNLWEQKILTDFAPQQKIFSVTIDEVWGTKNYSVFLEGAIDDNSDLEPEEGERAIRKTFTLRSECWLFDQSFSSRGIVKFIERQYRDYDTEDLHFTDYLPPKETIASAVDGATTNFTATVVRPPVLEHSLVIEATIGGQQTFVQDDGNGNLLGDDLTSGSITYLTGAVSLVFSTAPDAGTDITITYFTDLD